MSVIMSELKDKKFIASYSGGKDCTLAIHKAKNEGLILNGLIITYNTDQKRSWFHGIPESILTQVSISFSNPVRLIKTSGELYEKNFEEALNKERENGAEVCVFGDIDIEGHFEWCTKRCENVGLIPYFPLKYKNRRNVVEESIRSGFKSVITILNREKLSDNLLGKTLDLDIINEIEKQGADVCGENGEYHTFTYDGPLFKKRIEFNSGEFIIRDKYYIMPIN